MDGSHGGGAPPPIWSDADDFFTMPAGSETLIPQRVGAGAEHQRSGSCGLTDGVAVDPGIDLDLGVAAGECNGYTRDVAREGSTGQTGGVAQERSNGGQTGAAPVGTNGVEDGFTPERASGTSDSSIPESSGYKRR
jgi:hypothetical protein